MTKVDDDTGVNPTRLPYLMSLLLDFMHQSEVSPVILFDGFEYMVLENGFDAMFKFLVTLKDYAYIHRSTVILFVEIEALSRKERALLLSEFPLLED
nr:DUF835 domain-containing protein [Palaeococcus ferrophilus]